VSRLKPAGGFNVSRQATVGTVADYVH
jgi:hypothetical protein